MHFVTPVTPVNREKKSTRDDFFQQRKPIDTKVKGVVLERISSAKGGLLPSASSPQLIIDLLPAVESVKMDQPPRNKKRTKLRKTPLPCGVPLGLHPADPEGGVNSLMQFILHIPGFAEHFFFAPRSFAPFHEFIDQYHHDQQENRPLSSANGLPIFRFLTHKVPDLCLLDIFQFIIHSLQTQWQIHPNLNQALEKGLLLDLFVTESSQKRQLFISQELGYELDAFIELRPDGVFAHFFVYVKVQGSWYQCDNERITQLRSNNLALPLSRAILLHYKRIAFGKTGWF